MKDWKRTLAALLAAIMLIMPFTATAELALEPDALPEVDGGVELEIAPESVVDAPDVELELGDASIPDGLAVEGIDLDTGTIADAVIDGAEAEAGDPVLSNDDDDDDYDDDFDIDENGVLVEYRGDGGQVVIPEGVTSIGDSAFYDCDNLTGVTIPASVTSIGESAFGACDSLEAFNVSSDNPSYTSRDGILYTRDMKTLLQCPGAKTTVVVPNGVTSIGESAFEDCSRLAGVTIPGSVTSIGEDAFFWCDSLTDVTIHDGVKSIGDYSFALCDSLTGVTIPGSVTSIGDSAFSGCDSLTDVTILAKSIDIDKDAFYGSDPTFHIIEGSDAIGWAKSHSYDYDTFTEGLSKKSLTLSAGQTHKLTVHVQGKLTTDVTWSSSNRKVATVKAGTVTAVKAGKCTVTARVKNGKTFKCSVTVRDAAKLDRTKLSIKAGDSQTLEISGLNNRRVTWSSSNKKVATVKDGKITAVNIGRCIITAQIKNGKKLTCKVTVTDPAALSEDKLTISSVDSARIKLTGALKRKVTWSTSDDGVVKITKSDSSAASIKAVKNGPLTIKEDWDDDFDDLYSWEVGVKFTNNSNKKIIYVKFDILQYDNRGVKLQSPYDYYYFNDDIKPHDYWYRRYTVNEDTRSVKFKITEVTFADRTTWKP